MDDLSFRDLASFDALFSESQVSRAARRIGLSQPAMSMTLKRLRRVFGDQLFVRAGNMLVPTDKAVALRPLVERMLREMGDLKYAATNFDPTASNRSFTLILTDYIDAIIVPQLMRHLDSVGSQIKVKVVGPNPFRIGNVFSEREADVTVSYFPNAPDYLKTRKVMTDRMVCLVRRGHPALNADLNRDDFCRLDHISVEPGEATMYRSILDDELKKSGMERTVVLSKPDFLGVPFVLEQSDLVATLPMRLAKLFITRFNLEIFLPPIDLPEIAVAMMWHESTNDSAAHIWFRQQIVNVCKKLSQNELAIPDV